MAMSGLLGLLGLLGAGRVSARSQPSGVWTLQPSGRPRGGTIDPAGRNAPSMHRQGLRGFGLSGSGPLDSVPPTVRQPPRPEQHNLRVEPPELEASRDGRTSAQDAGRRSGRSRPSPARDDNRQPILEQIGKIIAGTSRPAARQLQGTATSRKLTLLSSSPPNASMMLSPAAPKCLVMRRW